MLELFLDQASSFAADVDALVWLITILVGFWFILAEGMFFYLIFRFRHREGQPSMYIDDAAEHKLMHTWIETPHRIILLCDVALIVGAIAVWSNIKMQMPVTDESVRIVVQQWAWTFQHAGPDGKLDTADDIRTVDEMHVQVGKKYRFEMTSRDVLHSFSIPVFRLKQDVIPGRTSEGWFEPTKAGEYDIQCAEICGIGHGIMPARLYVEYPEQHAKWLANPVPSLASNTPK